jgi:N-acylglucosamine-6-phosphate 2-epimerase
MDKPEIVTAMAEAAVDGGAAGLRIEGVANLRAVRKRVQVPIVAIIKADLDNSKVKITPTISAAQSLIAEGADIVAYDATDRARPDSREAILSTILQENCIAMADCSTYEDGQIAISSGAQILGTTLSGYTVETATADKSPDLVLVSKFAGLGAFVMAEGRYNHPETAACAITSGANAVTVGSALTRLEVTTSWFCDALKAR